MSHLTENICMLLKDIQPFLHCIILQLYA